MEALKNVLTEEEHVNNSPHVVSFCKFTPYIIKDAWREARQAIGVIDALRCSSVGTKCRNAKDIRAHKEEIRKVTDDESLKGFVSYLNQLTEASDVRPEIIAGEEEAIFSYTTASGKAEIHLYRAESKIKVGGYVRINGDYVAVLKGLVALDFFVAVRPLPI